MTPSESRALAGAGIAHLALLAGLSLGWAASKPLPVTQAETIPVEFVEIAPETTIAERPKPSTPAAPRETASPPPAETPPEPAPPEPVPDAVPPPEPAPPKPEPKPEPKPTPPKPTAKPKPAPPRPAPERLDAAELTDLIDKRLPKAKAKPLDTSALARSIADAIPKSARLDARAAASLQSAIRAQVAPCWNPPIGGTDVKRMTVVLRVEAGRDGRVLGRPAILSQTGVTGENGDYARAFAETARRAVLRCAPLKLPAELYDQWRVFELNFDPSGLT